MDKTNQDIAILMATYQGEAFITEQLNSIASQSFKNWTLWINDDGSTDQTCDHIRRFTQRYPAGKVNLLGGPQKGAVQNFMDLLLNPKINADIIALADQDDIWMPNHLQRGYDHLQNMPEKPALTASATMYVNEDQTPIGRSPSYDRPPSFANALVQNIASGNTMIFNHATLKLIRSAPATIYPAVHDWWVYLLTTGAEGHVMLHQEPTVLYRQHQHNEIGAGTGIANKFKRQIKMLQGGFHDLNQKNVESLIACRHLLSPENNTLLDRFIHIRTNSGFSATSLIRKYGLYRQTAASHKMLQFAAFMGKL